MNNVVMIMKKLATAPLPLSLDDLVVGTKCSRRGVSGTLTRLCKLKRISMVKEAGSRAKYSLTPDQLAQWHLGTEPKQIRTPVGSGLTAAELAARVRFLTDLGKRPAFVGHALLGDITTDYRRALARCVDKEDQAS